MPVFSTSSADKLSTCHSQLQSVLREVIQYFDFTVLFGYRNQHEQDALYAAGRSQLKYPASKHNTLPSLAVDVAPYPINWNDTERFALLAGAILITAQRMGIPLRWGRDWDMDGDLQDNRFNDYAHFEVVDDLT